MDQQLVYLYKRIKVLQKEIGCKYCNCVRCVKKKLKEQEEVKRLKNGNHSY